VAWQAVLLHESQRRNQNGVVHHDLGVCISVFCQHGLGHVSTHQLTQALIAWPCEKHLPHASFTVQPAKHRIVWQTVMDNRLDGLTHNTTAYMRHVTLA
jgi:hypothetical protein